MKLMPWRRNDEMSAFRDEFDELFNRFFTDEPFSALVPTNGKRTFLPPMNLAETDKAFTVSVEVPGMTEKDVHVEVRDRELVITGERKWEEEKKGKEFRRVESHYGAFERRIELPTNAKLEPDTLVATCKKGVLEISIPKVEPTPVAKIPVKAG
ncbi:MAG: Hsp20/alpha crystallin family protein [Planctomycetes bacterium]|nr:Hsp20/alpha crystallin family protein [Planctomycetota bacterium]